MISNRVPGTGLVMDASDAHGDGGCHRIGDPRTEAEATMGQRSKQRVERRPDRKGHVSPCNRLSVKLLMV
jgi:hypothetical protein